MPDVPAQPDDGAASDADTASAVAEPSVPAPAPVHLDGDLQMFTEAQLYEQRFTKDLQRSCGRDPRAIGMPSPGPGHFKSTDRQRCTQYHPFGTTFGTARMPQRMLPPT